jgi:Zn-dependent metalloprotease
VRKTVVLTVALAVLITACSSGDDTGATTPTESSPSTGPTTEPANEPSSNATEPAIVTSLAESDAADLEAWSGSPTTAEFVRPQFTSGEGDPEAAALAYLTTFADGYGVSDVDAHFETASVTESAAGTIVRFSQRLDDIPVFAGAIAVAVNSQGSVTRVSGVVVPDADLAEPSIDADQATQAATDETGLVASDGQAPSLVVYSPAVEELDTAPPIPAWRVIVADEIGLESEVIVSAIDGSILVIAGLDATEDWDTYDVANQLDDEGERTLDGAELVYETTDGVVTQISDNPHADATVVSGHFSTSWNYFLDTHGRDSFDDAGGRCKIYVRVGVGWKNASANRNCVLRFGDGRAYAQELDISAHEFTHAVTRSTADLVYENESGALNEHYSDFFAVMVDTSDWRILPTSRRMNVQSHINDYFESEDDNGGVHSNSRIGNTIGFLVAADGTWGNNGTWVVGLGRDKAAQIWYATLLGLGPRASYHGWACATIFTARDMVGSVLDAIDVESVIDAMLSSGLVYEIDGELSCDQTAGTGNRSPRPTGTEPEDVEPGPNSGTTTTTGVTTTTLTTPDECDLVGLWRLRDQEFFDQIAELAGGGATMTYESGDYLFEFGADGTAVGYRAAWSFRVSSPQGDLITAITSTDPGTWSADSSVLNFSSEAGDATVDLWIESGGQRIPLPTQSVDLPAEAIAGSAQYTCEGDVLYTVDSELGMTSTFDRLD